MSGSWFLRMVDDPIYFFRFSKKKNIYVHLVQKLVFKVEQSQKTIPWVWQCTKDGRHYLFSSMYLFCMTSGFGEEHDCGFATRCVLHYRSIVRILSMVDTWLFHAMDAWPFWWSFWDGGTIDIRNRNAFWGKDFCLLPSTLHWLLWFVPGIDSFQLGTVDLDW